MADLPICCLKLCAVESDLSRAETSLSGSRALNSALIEAGGGVIGTVEILVVEGRNGDSPEELSSR
jgi:hypothetical protein